MREITKADMDKAIEPKMARDAVTAVRDIAMKSWHLNHGRQKR